MNRLFWYSNGRYTIPHWTDHQLKVFAAAHYGRPAILSGQRLEGSAIVLDLPAQPKGRPFRLAAWAVFLAACALMFWLGAGRP